MRHLFIVLAAAAIHFASWHTAASQQPPEMSSHDGYILVTDGEEARAFVDNLKPLLPETSHRELSAHPKLTGMRTAVLDANLARTAAACTGLNYLKISTMAEPGALAELAKSVSIRRIEFPYFANEPLSSEALSHLSRLRSLQDLSLSTSVETDAIPLLAKFKNLKSLSLEIAESPDQVLQAISGLTQLKSLFIDMSAQTSKPTDESLSKLQNLTSLKTLRVTCVAHDYSALLVQAVSRLPGIERLLLRFGHRTVKLDSKTLSQLRNLTSLKSVSIACKTSEQGTFTELVGAILANENIEDISLVNVAVPEKITARFPQLEKLRSISMTSMFDASIGYQLNSRQLGHIAACDKITSLSLNCSPDDPSPPAGFKSLKSLEDLTVNDPTPELIESLKTLPHLNDLSIKFQGGRSNLGGLPGRGITAAHCNAIGQLKKLENLQIDAHSLDRGSLAGLDQAPRLKKLWIVCYLSSASLAKECPGLLTRLEELNTTSDILGKLNPSKQKFSSLRRLYFSWPVALYCVRDWASPPALNLKKLSAIAPQLKLLSLFRIGIQANTFAHLPAFQNLQHLEFSSCRLVGKSTSFSPLPKLEWLSVNHFPGLNDSSDEAKKWTRAYYGIRKVSPLLRFHYLDVPLDPEKLEYHYTDRKEDAALGYFRGKKFDLKQKQQM